MTATPHTQPVGPPSVTESDPKALAWVALADELTPGKSLSRIDAVTSRVVTNVTVVGTILTGLGLLTTQLPTITGIARGLAIAAVAAAIAAVGCALAAQILTIDTKLNTRNIPALKVWYRQQFRRRAYPTRAATILLISAILLAGAATITALRQPSLPRIAMTQTQTAAAKTPTGTPKTTIVVEVTFHDLEATDTLVVTVTAGNMTVAKAAATPQSDGTATRSITIPGIPANTPISATGSAGKQVCDATLTADPASEPRISCRR